jgi:protein SCO1/2
MTSTASHADAGGGGDTADSSAGLASTFAASLAVLALGLAALLLATDGGSAFTTETLRRSQVARAPEPVPDFSVVDAQGRVQGLHRLLTQGGRVWIVDFVYTRCQSLCLAGGSVMQRLQEKIASQGLAGRVGLLSISFDPLNDGPPALADHARRQRMQPELWQLVALRDEADRRRLLDAFGVFVVPAPRGEFEHNAALHLVDAQARLVRIVDLAEPELALASALALPLP